MLNSEDPAGIIALYYPIDLYLNQFENYCNKLIENIDEPHARNLKMKL